MTIFTGSLGCLVLIILFLLIIGLLFKGAFALLFGHPIALLVLVVAYFLLFHNRGPRGRGGQKRNSKHVEYEIYDDDEDDNVS